MWADAPLSAAASADCKLQIEIAVVAAFTLQFKICNYQFSISPSGSTARLARATARHLAMVGPKNEKTPARVRMAERGLSWDGRGRFSGERLAGGWCQSGCASHWRPFTFAFCKPISSKFFALNPALAQREREGIVHLGRGGLMHPT